MDNCIKLSTKVLCSLLDCALEYTIDDRGDIGVWVREAAVNSLEVCILFYNNNNKYMFIVYKYCLYI